MSEPTPKRFRTLKFNPLRDVLPWIAVVAGIVLTVRGAAALSSTGDGLFLVLGPALAVLGIVVFTVNRWQARRGH